MVSGVPGRNLIAWSSFLSGGNLWASFSEKTRQCCLYCGGSSWVSLVLSFCASMAHWVAAVVQFISVPSHLEAILFRNGEGVLGVKRVCGFSGVVGGVGYVVGLGVLGFVCFCSSRRAICLFRWLCLISASIFLALSVFGLMVALLITGCGGDVSGGVSCVSIVSS